MENSAKISRNSFLTSAIIIFSIMMIAGILTILLPSGEYERAFINGKTVIIEGSYHIIEKPYYPFYRWLTAPIEVLWSPDAVLVISIIAFILIVSGSIYILNKTRVIEFIINNIVKRYSRQKSIFLALVVLVFMLLGSLMGIFEEIIPLVPIMVMFSISLGWDDLSGLGMSLLATGFGFSAALANPFSLGVAQKIAGVPLFSGIGFRVIIFITTYLIVLFFLRRYTKTHQKEVIEQNINTINYDENTSKASKISILMLAILFVLILFSGFTGFLSDLMLPIVALLFLLTGLLSGLIVERNIFKVFKDFLIGTKDVLLGVPLVLMAVSVKLIITNGKIIDTILHQAYLVISSYGPFTAVFLIYLLFFIMDLFVPSASTKAFLMMPVIAPLADLVGITRQTTVLAFMFGDGFSNLLYPTNPVLLISLGLVGVSYFKWFKFVWKIQLIAFLLSLLYLYIAVRIGYGPV